MSSKKQPPESPGVALAKLRWATATEEDRRAVGEKLTKARKKISKKKRKEIARKAIAARWAQRKTAD